MKRRKLLKLLGLTPAGLLIASSCKEKLPSTPTIVTGKIIDENGLPLEGAGLRLTGRNIEGITGGYATFSIYMESDKEGRYKLTQLLPKDTDEVTIASMSTSKIIVDNQNYEVYILEGTIYYLETSPYNIPRTSWGKATTLNYQFIKL